jgi:hypothetical protein
VGFLPFLAFAGLPSDAVAHLNQIGWFLPFCALIIPVALILFFVFGSVGYLLLAVAQSAAIFCGLRGLISHLRHRHFTSYQVRLMLAPSYLVACFATNIITLIGVGVIRKFF